jgi:hypothetical protein
MKCCRDQKSQFLLKVWQKWRRTIGSTRGIKSSNYLILNFLKILHDTLRLLISGNLNFEHSRELTVLQGKAHHGSTLIKIADCSDPGWKTSHQYQSNHIASDSDFERHISNTFKLRNFTIDWLIFGVVLTPLSTICQLCHATSWWRKPEYPERTTDHVQATDKLYHLRLRVECTFVLNLQSQARIHAVLVIGLYELLDPAT